MLDTITIKAVKLKIGQFCKNKRKIYGLSRDELAKELDISRTTIQNIENGKNATLDNLLKVANHFNVLETISRTIDSLDQTDNNVSLY